MRLIPDTLFGRVTLILVAGLLAAQGAAYLIFRIEREELIARATAEGGAERIAAAVEQLERLSPSERERARHELWRSGLVSLAPEPPPWGNASASPVVDTLAQRLGGEREMRLAPIDRPGPPVVAIGLADGTWAEFRLWRGRLRPQGPPGGLFLNLGLTLAAVMVTALVAVRWATRPLKSLADGAAAFAERFEHQPIAEDGPREARRAAQAFNQMKARIRTLLDERTRTFSAMSHDLRTPLTRLRLRAEGVEDETLRERFAADLDEMQAMVEAALDYVRGLKDSEPVRPVDINALAASVAGDAARRGPEVTVLGRAASPYPGRSRALKRALENLVGNARTYAGDATIRIEDDASMLRLSVEDRGPGIPDESLARVLEPFQRLEDSRNRETGGIGLGLTIVRDVAALHGGRLILTNHPEGGLVATMELPRDGDG
jgi:signal transduction histidine kinase